MSSPLSFILHILLVVILLLIVIVMVYSILLK